MVKTAILVDGGFYLKRAKYFWGTESPKDMATRLVNYCLNHINNDAEEPNKYLYRIFYYDFYILNGKINEKQYIQ